MSGHGVISHAPQHRMSFNIPREWLNVNTLHKLYGRLAIRLCLGCVRSEVVGLVKTEAEGTALALGAIEYDGSALSHYHLLGHKKPQPRTVWASLAGIVSPIEFTEQVVLLCLWYANA